MEYSRPDYGDSRSEAEGWISYFRDFGLPAVSYYVDRNKKGFRHKVRLVYSDVPDLDEVREAIEVVGRSRECGEGSSLEVIDQGVRYRGYVVDVVWYT